MEIRESKIRHLEMLQEVITRMGGNSFVVKGWAVIAIGAMYTYWLTDRDRIYMLFLVLAVNILFWFHDAYYLALERGFRNCYDKVRKDESVETNFEIKPINVEKIIVVAVTRPILTWTYGGISIATLTLIFIMCMSS